MRPVNRSTSFLDIKFFLLKKVNVVDMSLQLFKKETPHFRPFLINFKGDFCEFLRSRKSTIIVIKLVLNFFLPFGNVRKCPAKGNIEWKNFNFNPNFMPSIWPKGYYKAVLNFWCNKSKKSTVLLNIYFELEEINKLN